MAFQVTEYTDLRARAERGLIVYVRFNELCDLWFPSVLAELADGSCEALDHERFDDYGTQRAQGAMRVARRVVDAIGDTRPIAALLGAFARPAGYVRSKAKAVTP